LWAGGASPFESFLAFTDWIGERLGRHHSIALATLSENLWAYLATECGVDRAVVEAALCADWHRSGRKERPPFLEKMQSPKVARRLAAKRQARHLAESTQPYAA
jgi:hypothetical protein